MGEPNGSPYQYLFLGIEKHVPKTSCNIQFASIHGRDKARNAEI